ncbi:RHS domain-containing protein [Acidovorax sp. NCPPB 3576]|nr:RHS domain-containing protein [Acidovorax sp. NCPPB 3576]WCM88930.1 RHS domain-containing protein [Acidovorax sp. NCPPB 3576]
MSQVFRYRYDALGRRIAKADAFGEITFVWGGLRLLQERRGGQTSSYVYEPGSYTPLARIDGHGALEAEHPAAALALGDVDTARGKENSVPTTNGEWADAHHAVAGPVGGLARMRAVMDKAHSAQPAVMENSTPTPRVEEVSARSAPPGARIYYFHTQGNGLPEEMSDRNGNLVWRAQYRAWGSAVAEEWQAFDAVGRPVGAPVAESWARASQQTAAAPQNLRMQGQYLDRETGLHYNTFRYYDPDLGAFTTPDPIGLAGGESTQLCT